MEFRSRQHDIEYTERSVIDVTDNQVWARDSQLPPYEDYLYPVVVKYWPAGITNPDQTDMIRNPSNALSSVNYGVYRDVDYPIDDYAS